MELNTLISQFFTDEEVKRAFTSICGTVEDGSYPITKYSVIDEFNEPLQRICDFINKLQNHINNLIATRNNPIIATIDGCKRDIVNKPSLPSDLDEVAKEYATTHLRNNEFPTADSAFKAGAKWMQDPFEKNRLANCDKLTKEENDRETDFATEIIEKEHRQPTFTDAINYGMRVMKEQIMKEAVEGTIICYNDETYSVESCCFDNKEHYHHSGDKARIIVLPKED